LVTEKWKVYEHREEPYGVGLILGVDSKYITALEGLGLWPFSVVVCATFSVLSAKPEGRKYRRYIGGEKGRGG